MSILKNLLLFFLFFIFISCEPSPGPEPIPKCDEPIGDEILTFRYFNETKPIIHAIPGGKEGNITAGKPIVKKVENGIDIIIPEVRIRTENNNYEITKFSVDETEFEDDCFKNYFELSSDSDTNKTDIATVLVLDMSTSLEDDMNQLKEYAKDFANTIVNSSSNSTVAVVFFSGRNTVKKTKFYKSSDISELDIEIENYKDYQNRTALYQATLEGIELLEAFDFEGEKSIVVFTDGGDNDSNNPKSLLSDIQNSTINKFVIGLRGKDFDEENLETIANQGGNFIVADNIGDLENIFKIVGRGVISVYELRYNRSDQILSQNEAIRVRFSIKSIPIK